MKRSLVLASILMINSSAAFAAPFTGNIGVFLGGKSMSDSQWTDSGNQGTIGIVSDFKQEHWPVSIAIDGFVSTNNGYDTKTQKFDKDKLKTNTTELHLGARKIWTLENPNFRPYVGGGLAFVTGSAEQMVNGKKKNDTDNAVGTWLGAGVYWTPMDKFNVGADVRYSHSEIKLHGDDVDTGNVQAGITLGYSW
jgi:opacity protein-like surface antigen